MSAKKQHKKKSSGSALVIVFLLAVIGAGLFGLSSWQAHEDRKRAESYVEEPLQHLVISFEGEDYRLRDDLDTYLIMGTDELQSTIRIDDVNSYNNLQADFQLLMVVDKTRHSYYALHLNRDSMVDIPALGLDGIEHGTIHSQLCLAYSFGSGGKDSCRNVAETVSRLLYGVPIEHYFAVTMDAIPVLNDLVDGVTVHIDEDLTKADSAFVEGRDVHLRGEQALHFVRARMSVSDGTNLSRMERQRTYISGLYEQMIKKLNESDRFSLKLANTLSEYATSDLITDELAKLADQLKAYQYDGIVTMEGEAVYNEKTDHIEFYPNEVALQRLVVTRFFRKL